MHSFKSILVDVDAEAAAHPALNYAIGLASRCDARLTIVDVVNVPPEARRYLSTETERMLIELRRTKLAAFAEAAGQAPLAVKVLEGAPAPALIEEVRTGGHDLLIRSHARDLVGDHPFGPVDMQLFRQCPCPVFAVGPGLEDPPMRILAAVHATSADETESRLNGKILDLALLLTEMHQGHLTVLQAWNAFGAPLLRSHYAEKEMTDYVSAAETAARGDLSALTKTFGDRIAGAEIVLTQGEPEAVISEHVVAHGIDLVVMGTVARTAIAQVIMGNTAERVLRRLLCSVLAVKPDG